MKINEAYFYRLNGAWSFNPVFRVLNWQGLFKSEATFVNKLRLASFVIFQNCFGPYQMNTIVDCHLSAHKVNHTTIVKKFGIIILRSEKIFTLNENGVDVSISGSEYLWPLNWKATAFLPMSGKIESSATRAKYGMPLIGLETQGSSIMELPKASIKITLPWFEGVFEFTNESMKNLSTRKMPSAEG